MPGLKRPAPDEYAEYYGTYITLVGPGDLVATLREEMDRTLALLERVPPDREGYRYEPGKWSVKDTIGHLIDTERLFTYRAMSFARGDSGPLPGMDQEQWAREADAGAASLPDLSRELAAVRGSTIGFFSRLGEEALTRRGVASDVEFSVRALAFIIAGHELHHRAILEHRYGLAGM